MTSTDSFGSTDRELRELSIEWDYTLVVLSYIVSLLGAYAASQVCSQAAVVSTGRQRMKQFYGWTALAAVLFGLCSVWSLHFLAMLAAKFDVSVDLAPGMTAFSACLAVGFTWLALVSDAFVSKLRRFRRRQRRAEEKKQRARDVREERNQGAASARDASMDLEAQPLLGEAREIEEEERDSRAGSTQMKQDLEHDSALRAMAFDDSRVSLDTSRSASEEASRAVSPGPHAAVLPSISRQNTDPATQQASPTTPDVEHHRSVSERSSRRPSLSFFSRKWSSGRTSANASSTDLSGGDKYSSAGSPSDTDPSSGSSSGNSNSLVRNLPLTKRERTRLKSGAGLASVPLKELLFTLWGDCTFEAIAKAGIWAIAICAMHYTGMSAFHLEQGFAKWNRLLVAVSYVIAFVVCLAGVLFMPSMEINAARQLAFSILAATGVFAMHYTGMAAASFYTYAPSSPDAGYPRYLSLVIVAFGILTSLISTTMVSHASTLSRNKLVEMISVKQQLWKTLAQKEAVEATVQLQTEFTSVAAHELRTPLYTITGYVDLLSRTQLDEEQSLYVETVRRACHTIQLITNNVLDWTRLERANDESQARPVLLEIRKFVCNLGEITEDRGPKISSEGEGLELIIDIADDVPAAIFVDETYLTRILMNLINNASKFCASGYIRVGARMEGVNLQLTVRDTGIGIPKRFLETIFMPFRQADTTLTRMNNGSGLGLAICKRLVARCNGELSVTSVEGEGSTFLVDMKDVGSTAVSSIGDTAPEDHPEADTARTMMVFASSAKVQKMVSETWAQHPHIIVRPSSLDEQALRSVDYIWTDLPTLLKQPELVALIRKAPNHDQDYPYILVIHSAETELLHLPPSSRVVPVKRPIAIHELAKLLALPKEELPTTAKRNKPKLVRFASSQSSADSNAGDSSPAPSESTEATDAPHEDLNPVPASADSVPALTTSKKTVLLVEDNLVNAKLGQRMLTTLGYEVLVAYNGLEAFESVKMAHNSIYAVLMDCQMPVMSGQESTILIRKYEKTYDLKPVAILALSANVNAASHNALLDAGANSFLSKPISLKQLGEALETCAIDAE